MVIAFIDSFTEREKYDFALSTSLEKEVLPVLRAFVVSRSLPVPGRFESCYLGIFAYRPIREASA